MGAAQALRKPFVPCVARGTSLSQIPPQAVEYQGVDLSSADGIGKLAVSLERLLDVQPLSINFTDPDDLP
jgi:hypothetical protein